MWSPLLESPPRSVAPAATSRGHQSARFGGIWIPTSGISRRASRTSRSMSSTVTGDAHAGAGHVGPLVQPGAPVRLGGLRGDVGRLLAVVAAVRDEVLEDDLLQVPEAGERLERRHPVGLGLADPDEDPAREGDLQRLGVAQRRQPQRGVLRRRGLVRDEVGPQRLDHQPLRGGHLAQPREVVAAERAEVRVREDPALQRALAGPRDVADEVVEAELGEPLADARVVARVVAGEDEQLLDVAARRAVDQRLDLVRARAGAADASRTRSTCSATRTCATATT